MTRQRARMCRLSAAIYNSDGGKQTGKENEVTRLIAPRLERNSRFFGGFED